MMDMFRRTMADVVRHRFLHGTCFLTISLAVFIVSAFGLFLINAGELMDAWQQGVRITAYLESDVSGKQALALAEDLEQKPEVASVSHVSGEEGLEWLKKQIGGQTDLLAGLSENPLPDALEIRPERGMTGADAFDALAKAVAARAEVADVEYGRNWLHRFYGVYNLFRMTAVVMAALVIVAIMFIGANPFRLILYSRQEEIEITRIIGADEAFVKYPLYLESMLLGLCGAVAGLLLLYGGFLAVMPKVTPGGLLPIFEIRFLSWGWIFTILAASMFVGWLGCRFTVRRFLRI
ncbi:MAG: cell division protein FtsX [Desulfosalsimonas sp.]